MPKPAPTRLFSQFGVVQSAQVIQDRETGRSKGFGFVQMQSLDAARRALATLNGRANADYALSRRDTIAATFIIQRISFERPDDLLPYLRGGRSSEGVGSYRRRMSARGCATSATRQTPSSPSW